MEMTTTPLWLWAAVLLAGYGVGSFPTGYVVARRLLGIDIREHGSRNVGATNVGRVVGKKAGLFTLAVDFLKGLLPVVALRLMLPGDTWLPVALAIALIVGHSRSVFLGFKGGKSAITGLGAVMALSPVTALLIGVIAYSVIKLSRTVSIGSMTAAVCTPLLMWWRHDPFPTLLFGSFAAVYVIALHRANIIRLLQGTENRLS